MSEQQNPYQSPLVDASAEAPHADGIEQDANSAYQSTQAIGRAVRAAFWVFLANSVLIAAAGAWQLATLGNVANATQVSPAELAFSAVAILLLVNYLVCIVLYSKWKYRSYSNLRSFDDQPLEMSPGWAVGFYFVPLMNLVKPYRAMKEIYNISGRKPVRTGTPLLGFWWGAWLFMNFFDNASNRVSAGVDTIEGLELAIGFDIVSSFFTIVATLLVISVVRAVDARQHDTAVSLGLEAEEA